MISLQELNENTIYSIRKLFTHLIKTVFYHEHQLPCPKYLSVVRDLAFLPKLIGVRCLWKELQLSLVAELLSVTLDRLHALINNPQLLQAEQQECYTAGRQLVEYRLSVQQDLPTRLRHVYSWNLNSWKTPCAASEDPKTRRCRRLLKSGPVCLQETRWDNGAPEKLGGYLPGTKVFASEGACLDSGKRSGGVAILVPPGWKVERAHELVPAKGLALLIRDRSTQFYLVSVYLHPESKKRDLEKLMQEWARLEKDTARVIFVGDFNRIDETHSALWNSFLGATSCVDIDPKLITYYTQEVSSPLDRCLLPAEWISSASWNPVIRTLHPVSSTGHKILRISMQLKPSVVNNPKDPKHEVLPTDLFMPGRHPSAAKQADIQALIRLIHREVQSDPQCNTCYQSLAFGIDLAEQAEKRKKQVTVEDGLNRSSLPSRNGPIWSNPRDLEVFTSQHLSLSANFWTWWRTQEAPKANPAVAPHLLARKYLKGTHEWVNIPRVIVEELVKHSRGAVIQSVEHLPVVQGACSIPKVVLQDCFDVIDTLQESVSFVQQPSKRAR